MLASLEESDRASLAAHLKRAHYAAGDVLFDAGQELRNVCFPQNGAISLIAGTGGGAQVEIAAVGNEGMVGMPLLLGGRDSANVRAVCQIPSDSLYTTAAEFIRWLDEHPGRRPRVLEAYAQLQFTEAVQAVVCNRLHSLGERCARWLLVSHDRAGAVQFPITHEFLAQVLGVRRASVTLAMRRLRRLGLIEYRRGSVRVLDRQALEGAACECYAVVQSAQQQLLPPPETWRRPSPAG